MLLSTESVCRQHSLVPLAWITGVALAHAAHQTTPTEGLAAANGRRSMSQRTFANTRTRSADQAPVSRTAGDDLDVVIHGIGSHAAVEFELD